jgi:MerR family transcriptional regulator, Zn(II)-responsive regulator of zntA
VSKEIIMTANILAKKTNATVYTVRYYTRVGLLKPSRHPHNNYKIYQLSDVARLRFITVAKNAGFTLAEIARIFEESNQGQSRCPFTFSIIKKKIVENKKKIRELERLQENFETAFNDFVEIENSIPNGTAVNDFVKAIAEVKK